MSADPSSNSQSPATGSEKESNPAALAWYEAVWDALWSKTLDFYPRVKDSSGSIISLDTRSMVKELNNATLKWTKLKAEDLEDAIKLARQSLDESKEQTEYQDQKATRLLTVTTFLTALSGVLFTRFNDTYPIDSLSGLPCWAIGLLILGYLVFSLFLLTALMGAIVTFHATRTRFKYPKQETAAREEGPPNSRLFYSGIISIRPRAWSSTFVIPPADGTDPKLHDDVVQAYYRDLVSETYLVAAKTADKLRYLEPAQNLLSASLKFLLLWLFLLPVIAMSVTSEKAAQAPLQVNLSTQDRPIKIEAVPVPMQRSPDIPRHSADVQHNNAETSKAATATGAAVADRDRHE